MTDLIGIAVGIILLILIIYYFHKRERRWEQRFLEETALVMMRLESPLREKVAKLLLLANYTEAPFPKRVKELLEMNANAREEEVWKEYGL